MTANQEALGATVVAVSGELDIANDELAVRLAAAVDGGAQHVVVDLLNVTFIDSSVVRSLVLAHRTLLQRGGWLRLVYTHHLIGRVLEICGLDSLLPRYTSVEAAMGSPYAEARARLQSRP